MTRKYFHCFTNPYTGSVVAYCLNNVMVQRCYALEIPLTVRKIVHGRPRLYSSIFFRPAAHTTPSKSGEIVGKDVTNIEQSLQL